MKTMQTKLVTAKGKLPRWSPFPDLKTCEVLELLVNRQTKTAVVTYVEKTK